MTTLLATGAVRNASLSERALLRLSAAVHAAVLAHAARRTTRRPLEQLRRDAAIRADARGACVHLGLLPR